jgi:hypothetical protein
MTLFRPLLLGVIEGAEVLPPLLPLHLLFLSIQTMSNLLEASVSHCNNKNNNFNRLFICAYNILVNYS